MPIIENVFNYFAAASAVATATYILSDALSDDRRQVFARVAPHAPVLRTATYAILGIAAIGGQVAYHYAAIQLYVIARNLPGALS